ncbi:hypothetical protein FOZ60_011622 [Perkinsus olseni]|uniref:Uncharacterized protein n=1 Tax=Perkinsus olseni TaxID=32597 RepID=A0A7J6PAL4_PEROL|nr:hypothetical protein FOZ62_023087 [Perkinsus olseni]KAF4693158.1 hypothetical protein FOZ60_011622 [Perkinsus olseni]
MLLPLLLLLSTELVGVVMAATPDTRIDLTPGVYVGYANPATEICWPDMARVVLLVGHPPGTAALGYTNKSDVDLLIASGSVGVFSDSVFPRSAHPGECFYINAYHYYSLRTLLQMTGPKPTHVPICLGRSHLVLFNDARREPVGKKFTRLSCAISLTKNTYIDVATPSAVTQDEANAEEVGRKWVKTESFYVVAYDAYKGSPLRAQLGKRAVTLRVR